MNTTMPACVTLKPRRARPLLLALMAWAASANSAAQTPEELKSPGVYQIKAPAMYGLGVTGLNVTMAIIDTGIMKTHPEFRTRVLTGFNAFDGTTALGWNAAAVQAGTPSADGVFDSVSVYAGQGADHNLRELPGLVISGRLDWDKSYFTALGLGKDRGTLGQSVASFQSTPFASFRHGYEMVLVQHRGLQGNAELGAAYIVRTPDLQMGPLGVNFGVGAGLSYALGTPSYEDGQKDDPERRYRLQLLVLFEFEWRMRGFENLSVITRVHHRSGVYGLVAPQHVGSNFLALGVRYKF